MLSLYRLFGSFKGLLFIAASLIILGLLVYTQKVVNELRRDSRQIVEFYAQLYARAASTESSEDLQFLFDEIIKRTDFPIISTDPDRKPTAWKGIGIDPEDHSPETVAKVQRMVKAMAKEIDPIPLKYENWLLGYLYYGDSKLITQLQWLPFIEITVVALFIFVGYLGFRHIQRSEQRIIWVGMAKETAHQLGTPLSSLMGWLELLRSEEGQRDLRKTFTEMESDVKRLYKVAARFSQIGSKPDLKDQDIVPVLKEVVQYFQRRLPQMGKEIKIVEKYHQVPRVGLNKDLFEWAVENLIRNSLDALDKQQGCIEIDVGEMADRHTRVYIDIRDNGKGMDSKVRKQIFKPGFSTKKRGWGLGLNLAKRIVEDYHGGRLFLKETRPGEGTTMRIVLG